MTLMWRKSLLFVILLFQSRTFGRFEKQKYGSSITIQTRSRGETAPSIRALKHKGRMFRKKGKSEKFSPISTLSPTSTQLPAPHTAIPTTSTATPEVPVSIGTHTPTPYTTSLPTALLFQTFTPTVGASVAPTYLISIGPSGTPSKFSEGSIQPSSMARPPTLQPSGSSPTVTPPTMPPSSPSAPTLIVPPTPSQPTPTVLTPTPSPPTPPTQSPLNPPIPTEAPVTPTETPPTPTEAPPPTQTPPTPTQTPGPPTENPPSLPTQEPQSVPPTVAPSQVAGPQVVDLSPFTLNYTLARPRIPFRTEYVELANVTGVYLENVFLSFFKNVTGVELEAVVAIYIGASIFFTSPIQVELQAVASFSANTTPLPTVAELDEILITSFTGTRVDDYVNFIQHQLPEESTFTTTENVTLVPTMPKSSTTKISEWTSGGGSRKSTGGGTSLSKVAISIGAAAAAAFLTAMVVMYRRHRVFDPTTNIDKRPPSYTSITGGTCDNSSLEDSSSIQGQRRYQGAQDNSDEQSVDSSNWGEFIHQSVRSYKRSPRQIMSEMDLLSAMGEGPECSS